MSSFRVYSPRELAHVALRPGCVARPEKTWSEELKETFDQVKATSPQKIARIVAIGLGATLLLFIAIIALANATDDTLSIPKEHSKRLASKAIQDSKLSPPPPAMGTSGTYLPPVIVGTPGQGTAKTDFELPDQNTPTQRTATTTKRVTPKQGKRSVGSGVTIRNAPF